MQIEEVIGNQVQFCVGNIWMQWMCIGGDQDVFGVVMYVVIVGYGMCIEQMVVCRDVYYVGFIKVFVVVGVDVGDVGLVMDYQFFL